MKKLHLTLACGDYDRTRALKDGSVQPQGIDLTYLTYRPSEIFWRMFKFEEFDVSEMSLSSYVLERSRGINRFIAIPVFPSRMFRHGFIFVNTGSGIQRPEDLIGKRVGVPEYQQTASVWIRAFLQHDYGVTPDQVFWVQGGLEDPGRQEKVELCLPAGIRIQPAPEGRSLSAMLEAGELDALVTARFPTCFINGSANVRRLFPDYRTVEIDYFRRTGIFPIMHTVVMRDQLYREHPWVATSLYYAFCEAKAVCYDRMVDSAALGCTLPWFLPELENERQVLGHDLWPYGLSANRATLDAFVQYSIEQGLAERKLEVESLFAPSTADEFKM
ncbi:MAG: ABC transporter substrate-binding protein [Dehalococcoidia bacterium]|nr:ABC transporter substrate-binding protein [Dehalococcoidia bacterium]